MQPSTLTRPAPAKGMPDWIQDAVFYQIFPDRFARSEAVPKPSNLQPWGSPPTVLGFQGGDLLGVAERLDYLQDLGVSALYFTPVFTSAANHRYHTYDYTRVDPILGGNAALETLLREAHQRGMRVVLDGVFNHASRGFFQFNHILENGPESPYLDWFSVHSWPLNAYSSDDAPPGYAAWWNLRELPKFNTATPAVREFLWGIGERWIEAGIDGWRLDVPSEIDDDPFWQEFRRRVKLANPDAYIVGEIWGDARRWLQGDQFDAVMNYLFTRACLGFFTRARGLDDEVIQRTGLYPVPPLDAAELAASIESLLGLYSWQVTLSQLNLLGSHDTPRFRTIAQGDDTAYRLATLFQMTYPGAPCIYYGDEIGLEGRHDPDNRRAFPWDSAAWDEDLRAYVKTCIALRQAHPVLRTGGYATLLANEDVYAFARALDEEIAIVALNAGTDPQRLALDLPVTIDPSSITAAWGNAPGQAGGRTVGGWLIPARTGTVLLARTEAGDS